MSTSIIQTQLQALRLKYNAVYTAYRGCVEALGKVSIEGETSVGGPASEGSSALRELTEARANLLAAMRDSSDEKLA